MRFIRCVGKVCMLFMKNIFCFKIAKLRICYPYLQRESSHCTFKHQFGVSYKIRQAPHR